MKKPKAPRLVTVSVLTTITIIFWVFYGLYELLTSEPSLNIPPEILSPISPTLDINSLDKLQQRIFFEQGQTIITPGISENPSPTPSPQAEEITLTPTGTPTE
ncbi:hypothetical protein A2686_04440 [Candidatus Woesebacteria bacterium RIFCSPHIGHO2_01_FULL_38_10]|uniref:Uncharacterized protein n=1 Tax=Candidatus Woesebacteria bacterium RIFCSPLOWO2_01_FULL_39_10b TaxID=1802517 RepID=A0A1F8BA91_9BACT|nr:MAG: hypothetical protein A2686_04440 [Candidatus Woesebacteria bacterium RIFCSPHIGHO2_01_FULL_38_10]OGM60860.1 MAG: hypothetical protein A2892_04365 [Candidatus Woesebacteria bacterium RIFCSPLOWO2_01_FULL_39_10b]